MICKADEMVLWRLLSEKSDALVSLNSGDVKVIVHNYLKKNKDR
jgi:hypothetical protein